MITSALEHSTLAQVRLAREEESVAGDVHQVCSSDGEPLDARFEVEPTTDGWAIVFHARYGGRASPRATNTDYFEALELLLARLAAIGALIRSVAVDSSPARKLPVAQRVLPTSFPRSTWAR